MTQHTGAHEWKDVAHALGYLARADQLAHRTEGEATLLEHLPERTQRVLDLGTGDGRLLALVMLARPVGHAVALDVSPTMLTAAADRFAGGPVVVRGHDLDDPLPLELGRFDAVVSSFAIHHLAHERKRALYAEVFDLLTPTGVLANLEHVASPTPALHERFLAEVGYSAATEDKSNKLLDMASQLAWLTEIGFTEVDCLWKWRELALLVGTRPAQ